MEGKRYRQLREDSFLTVKLLKSGINCITHPSLTSSRPATASSQTQSRSNQTVARKCKNRLIPRLVPDHVLDIIRCATQYLVSIAPPLHVLILYTLIYPDVGCQPPPPFSSPEASCVSQDYSDGALSFSGYSCQTWAGLCSWLFLSLPKKKWAEDIGSRGVLGLFLAWLEHPSTKRLG
jgi:hypothetical protein